MSCMAAAGTRAVTAVAGVAEEAVSAGAREESLQDPRLRAAHAAARAYINAREAGERVSRAGLAAKHGTTVQALRTAERHLETPDSVRPPGAPTFFTMDDYITVGNFVLTN